MVELIVRKITVTGEYVPKAWGTKVLWCEMEEGVAQAILEGADNTRDNEIGLKDYETSVTHWFKMKDVPLDTKLEGYKALLSVEIVEQMISTRSLVSLEQVAI